MLKNRYQIARLPNRQSIYSLETDINVNNVNYTSHGCKDKETLKENKTENMRTLSCWLCRNLAIITQSVYYGQTAMLPCQIIGH